MTGFRPVLLFCGMLALLSPGLAAATLTLREAEILAVERNLNLQAQTSATRAAEALVKAGFGIYDPELQADAAVGEVFGAGGLDFQTTRSFTSDYRRFNLALLQRFPTGGSLALTFDNERQDIDSGQVIQADPYYSSAARISLVQPLLRGFGRTVTEQEILFASRDRNIALQELRQQSFNLLAAVRDAWFDVLRFRDLVAFRRTSVALAEQVLKENRARVEVGSLPPVEILEARVGVQLRERELLEAERAYSDAIDRLTLRLNLPEPVEVAEEALSAPAIEVDFEAGLQAAYALRPDLLQQLEEVERLELSRRIAQNNRLPQLDLGASYGHTGLQRNYGDAFADLDKDDLRSWEVRLFFSYPIGNTAAENQLLQTRLLLDSRKALLAQLRDEIRQEIRAAIRDLEVSRKVIEVTELGTRLAQERLDMLLKRKEVGFATTRDVLEGEEDLAQARTDQIAALAAYNQALTAYLRATGQLLEREGIRIAGDYRPAVEEKTVLPE